MIGQVHLLVLYNFRNQKIKKYIYLYTLKSDSRFMYAIDRCGKAADSFQSSILLIHCFQHQIPCNKMTTANAYTGVYCTLHLIDQSSESTYNILSSNNILLSCQKSVICQTKTACGCKKGCCQVK